MNNIYIDTNIWIYFLEANPEFGDNSAKLLEFISKNEVRVPSSVLTIVECMPNFKKGNKHKLYDEYMSLFTSMPGFKSIEISEDIADTSAELRLDFNLKAPDAIHLATALNERCEYFITEDSEIKKLDKVKLDLFQNSLKIINLKTALTLIK